MTGLTEREKRDLGWTIGGIGMEQFYQTGVCRGFIIGRLCLRTSVDNWTDGYLAFDSQFKTIRSRPYSTRSEARRAVELAYDESKAVGGQ